MSERRIRIGRTLPPAAAPIYFRDIVHGLCGWSRGGQAIEEMEADFRSYFGVRHCSLVSSGKAALTLILMVLKEMRPERDEVLIPAFTCYSVPSAIVRAGLKVTLCDIEQNTFDFDYVELEKKLDNPHLLCVIPTHLFGMPSDIRRLRGMVKDPAVTIVEDAAQAMGGEWKGERLGTLGDVGFFSLGRGKALSTVEGGIILTDCTEIGERLAAKVRTLEDYTAAETISMLLYATALAILLRPSLFWLPSSLPFLRLGETVFDPHFRMRKMSGFQAGLARRWREKLEDFQHSRRRSVGEWMQAFPGGPQRGDFTNMPALLRLPGKASTPEGARTLTAAGKRFGLGISPAYPDAVHTIPALAGEFSNQEFPAARALAGRIVTLPVHCFVTRGDREKIMDLVSHVEMTWSVSA